MDPISLITDGYISQKGETIVTKEIIAIADITEIDIIGEINIERNIVAVIEATEIELTAEINVERNIVAEINPGRSIIGIIEICECED